MPGIWHSIGAQVAALQSSHALKTQWAEAAEFSQPVQSMKDLLRVLSQSRLSESDIRQVRSHYREGCDLVHYGFEADYHALVYFKNGTVQNTFAW